MIVSFCFLYIFDRGATFNPCISFSSQCTNIQTFTEIMLIYQCIVGSCKVQLDIGCTILVLIFYIGVDQPVRYVEIISFLSPLQWFILTKAHIIFHHYEQIQYCAKRRIGSNTGKTEVYRGRSTIYL
jgi:hypothetical protein